MMSKNITTTTLLKKQPRHRDAEVA